MKGLVLAKVDLPSDWIGAAVGEPYIVKSNLFKLFDPLIFPEHNDFEYTKPQGYDSLVKFLEDKHQAPVIISNGAKQAIGALFFALKKKKIKDIYMRTPWWSLFPPLINMHRLKQAYHPYSKKSAYLMVSPNNPDGSTNTNFIEGGECKYTIHDAAYYNSIYMSPSCSFEKVGDVQVFTCSKLFGLSQLRIGYSVFYNTDLYNDVLEYMEHMTVGTSILSQVYALELLQSLKANPILAKQFEKNSHDDLLKNRLMANQISDKILSIDPNQQGMFLWAKCHNLKAFEDNKIMVIEGTPFGMPGYIRMNLALPHEQIKEIVDRLNT